MKGLQIAIKGYKTEYLRLPTLDGTNPTTDSAPYSTTDPEGKALIEILLAQNVSKNPRQILFWDPPPTKSNGAGYTPEAGFKDPWGQRGYRIILDYSGDGKVSNPEWSQGKDDVPAQIESDVILYSAGADGDFDTWKDNVRSWQ